jgi:predicted amidohydrolase YtcJ
MEVLEKVAPKPAGKSWAKASMPQKAYVMVQGLIDAHVHLLGGGQTLSWVDLRHANSKAAVAEAVKAAVGQ